MKTTAERLRDLFLLAFTFVFIYSVVAGLNYDINYWTWDCHESATVTEIVEVSHRTAWATPDNGDTRSFNQPQELVPGKEVCLSGERVRNSTELTWWMLPVKMFE